MAYTTFGIPSTRGDTDLCCYEWLPEGEISAAVHIHHGMTSHATRYDGMARYLNRYGIAVYGHDCLGHGATEGVRGHFADRDGDNVLVEDLRKVISECKGRCPGVPFFVAGHSMGSFVLRRFVNRYGGDVQGAIILGTGMPSPAKQNVLLFLLRLKIALVGAQGSGEKISRNNAEKNNSHFDGPPGPGPRWLTRNPDIIANPPEDPLRIRSLTLGGFRDLIRMMRDCARPGCNRSVPPDLPILILSGDQDVIGDFGKGVERTAELYRGLVGDVEMKLYPGGRHDMLEDPLTEEMFGDIMAWILEHSDLS